MGLNKTRGDFPKLWVRTKMRFDIQYQLHKFHQISWLTTDLMNVV